eukprot:CCRYP_009117-RE/>CCRYP_009117-RE protein AED:0.47 eAED:0.75 QI:0/0/0/1/0/0/2/0/85
MALTGVLRGVLITVARPNSSGIRDGGRSDRFVSWRRSFNVGRDWRRPPGRSPCRSPSRLPGGSPSRFLSSLPIVVVTVVIIISRP